MMLRSLLLFSFLLIANIAAAEPTARFFFDLHMDFQRTIAKCVDTDCFQGAYVKFKTSGEVRDLSLLSKNRLESAFKFEQKVATRDISDKNLSVTYFSIQGAEAIIHLASTGADDSEVLVRFAKEDGKWKLQSPQGGTWKYHHPQKD